MLLARDTCSAEYSATKSHPSCFLVPSEIINDKPWIIALSMVGSKCVILYKPMQAINTNQVKSMGLNVYPIF